MDHPASPDVPPEVISEPIIVGIGASAGGIEALETFFSHMPVDSGMAFVVIQHLAPLHDSILTEILQHHTQMPVRLAQNDLTVEANTVYVIPPNNLLALFNGKLQLLGPTDTTKIRLPIDYFFRSMAADTPDRAVGIILSGTGSDGTLGLKEIKGEGGIILAQEPTTAQHEGMPQSAINTGLVDFVLAPQDMPAQLARYQQLAASVPAFAVAPDKSDTEYLHQILLLIRTQTGHDFVNYKAKTIRRRVERLMAVNQIDRIDDYVRFLQNNTIGIEALFRDMLIGVTSFFRDKEFFASVRQLVIPRLFENRRADEPLRIWVAGCSTGEEAYSFAILMREHMATLKKEFRVQIFATDLDSYAVNSARKGLYPRNIELDVPEQYLHQYFLSTSEGYQVVKALREMVVFAPHSLIKDPPFSRVDLISCRNVLIYLNSELQDRILSFFHYALLPEGYLLLGTSESLGHHDREFKIIHAGHKIFQVARASSALRPQPETPSVISMLPVASAKNVRPTRALADLKEITETLLLTDWTPTCILINEHGHLLYVHGQTGKYLEIAPGPVHQLDIIQSAREGLKLPLTTAVYRAITQKREIYVPAIAVKTNGSETSINLTVKPLANLYANEHLLAVILEPVNTPEAAGLTQIEAGSRVSGEERDTNYEILQQEMSDTREYLQATIEELKSSNEEMQSVNEELQSVNEELETSQEELKAVNEELQTSNSELEGKINELNLANNDLENSFNSIHTGIILLDSNFQVRRYNMAATRVFKLIRGDIGRPVAHVVSDLSLTTLHEEIETVFSTLVPYEVDVETKQGQWYALQIRPYRTLQNAIKGIVISFYEMTARKQTEEIQAARLVAEAIFNTVREPLLMLDAKLRVVNANRAFFQTFDLRPDDTLGRLLTEVNQGLWSHSALTTLLKTVIKKNVPFEDYKLTFDLPGSKPKPMLLNARQLQPIDGQPLMVLVAIDTDPAAFE